MSSPWNLRFSDPELERQLHALSQPPPTSVLPAVHGAITKAVERLGDGESGFVFVHEHSQDGEVHQTNAAFVKRFGPQVKVVLWIGRDWDKPGTFGYGAELVWKF